MVMSDDVLVKVEHVSKKFCRTLKRSLWYGVQDVVHEMLGHKGGDEELRPGEFWAVNDVSFELKRGECLGLIGHNGAGKTTLLRMLNGLIKPDGGRIEMRGRMGALIALGAGFNPILTGRENIYINASVLGLTKQEIDEKIDEIVDFAEIGEFIDSPVKNYSSGMQVRLGFAVAAQVEPDVLIIDEVLAVGDLGFRMKCYTQIGKMLQNSAVIFVSHNMTQVARICDRAMFLDHGSCELRTSELAKAIDLYYSKFGSIKRLVTGSGLVVVDCFKFLNKRSEADFLVINGGEKIQFKFEARALSRTRHIKLQLEVWNQEVRPSAELIFRHDANSFFLPQKGVSIVVEIPQVPFSSGRYFLTVNVLDVDTHEIYCRVGNVGEFLVSGAKSCASDVVLPGEINILPL